MNTYAAKSQENKSQSESSLITQKQRVSKPVLQFEDNRPEAVIQRKLQKDLNNSPHINQLKTYQAMADGRTLKTARGNKNSITTLQRKVIENFILPGQNPITTGVIQRAIKPVDTGALTNNAEIQGLIHRYNTRYQQETLDRLVALAGAYNPTTGQQIAELKNLITELDTEAGNRHVVTERVNLPRNMNDADEETMEKNCALTSVGAVVGCKASDVHTGLGGDGSEQDSDIFRQKAGETRVQHDALSGQINGMVDYVAGAFERMGFSVTITGQRDSYPLMSAADGLAAMKRFPTGTKFLVYLSKTRLTPVLDEYGNQRMLHDQPEMAEERLGSHWVFADRYGSQVFFYDYQVGRVQAEIERQGEREIVHGGGAASPVARSGSSSPAARGGRTSPVEGAHSGFDMSAFSSALANLASHDSDDESHEPAAAAAPAAEQEMPEVTFEPRIPLYSPGNVNFTNYNEMFFVAVIPHIANRNLLRTKFRSL